MKIKKVLRKFLSGSSFAIFLLLIELLAIIFLQFFASDIITAIIGNIENAELAQLYMALGYIFLKLIGFIVALIIFFKIINKQEDPEFKIPWIVGMLLLPFFFSIMYMIFANHGLRKKDKRIISKSNEEIAKYMKFDKEKMTTELGNAIGAFRYINSTTTLSAYNNNKVTYFSRGEHFFKDLMTSLKEAKRFIFIEFFIITDGKLWSEVQEILKAKAQEGVEIRIVYDDMGCGGTISSRTPKILRKYGIKCVKFHPFRPILSGVYNNRDHRKIVVIDNDIAYTGGANLADEYANIISRFGYWKDTMIRIEGSAINSLIAIFLQNYDLSVNKVSDYGKYLDYEYPKYEEKGFVMPYGDGPGGIDDALIGEQTYINLLNYAKEEVYISTPYLVPTYSLLDAMRNAALRGVDVHLFLPGIPDKKLVFKVAQSNFRCLLDAGVKIHIYKPGFNHMKTVIADDKLAVVGTINFDFRSLVHHFECASLLYDCPCLVDIKNDFQEMESVSTLVPDDFKMSKSTKRICSLIKIISALL